ncbi:MAG TPA: DUF262 domain-containing protein [Actinopolymorphaceae bacterium]|jgi:hypothetical protein
MAKLSVLLDQIDSGTLLLPEFQRGYVWNRDQVRGLMRSLYQGFPVGGLLLWETDIDPRSVRGEMTGGVRLLLLDGQQRITSLYGVIRGRPPVFFEGDAGAFTGLHFNVEREVFEFYAPTRMRDDPTWIDVTKLFTEGIQAFVPRFSTDPKLGVYVERLSKLTGILNRNFHEEKIIGRDMTVDVVVEIFNRVNSGGTELSKGDLALAKLCAQWPEARQTMRAELRRWKDAGFNFSLEWLLRNATAVATGRAPFAALDGVSAETFQKALRSSVDYIDRFLNAVAGRLGLDHDRVLMGRYAFPVVSRFLHLSGGTFRDATERDLVLFWYAHAALRGRYTGSTETMLAHDYEVLERDGVAGLLTSLERWRGSALDVQPHDFEGATTGSRFYPLLYMLTRVNGSRDLGTGLELRAELLGRLASLQLHHIFPKAVLYRYGYERGQVNAIANFCFLTQETNLAIGKRLPAEYLAEAEEKHPGVLASQWIPTDPALWSPDRYLDFLAARRELLADAARSFLAELSSGVGSATVTELRPVHVIADDPYDVRTAQVKALVEELTRMGCVEPELDSGLADPVTGRELAVAEAFWPHGLQPGQGKPVVLELDPDVADLARLEELGYEVFTSVDALRGYVTRRNEEMAGAAFEEQAMNISSEATNADGGSADASPRAAFERAMRAVYERARDEAGYNPTYFLGMLAEYGGLATARKLLRTPTVSDGFAALWERGRLDLTVEAIVIQPQFAELFDDDEIEVARRRLEQFGYTLSPNAKAG